MRITKVYTRVGDKGTTRLVGGAEIAKDHARIEAYGTVDELNTILGLARTFNARSEVDADVVATLDATLAHLQNDLFNVGADLATPAADRWPGMIRVDADDATRLEGWIDTYNADLPPLKEFILPGGGPVGAFLHQARTVCRRAERRVVTLQHTADDVGDGCMVYLNRLSDLLFVLSRWAAKALGETEYFWSKPG
ncbi:MAG: cob(I)yrinic acid a,c-diamide adenosyltransferase [Alphaproteobacteria bacterium]|nr:cob(I)yrinic acid a,c-diamide adenosyltransferase [Alphaproteobacteria bacterium]